MEEVELNWCDPNDLLNHDDTLFKIQNVIKQLIRNGHSLRYIQKFSQTANDQRFHLRSFEKLQTAIVRTALHLKWSPHPDFGCNKGDFPYLCQADENRLLSYIDSIEKSNDFTTTEDVANFAHNLHRERYEKAVNFLHRNNHSKLAERLIDKIYEPVPKNWVKYFSEKYDLNVSYGTYVDTVRIGACNRIRIMNFMNQHQVLLKSFNPALIFNADETGIENKRMLLKLVTMYNNNPHIPLNRNELHITATGAFNSIGKAFPLFITLPAVKNLPQDCSDLIHEATFSSTCNGWQTSGSFYAFAVHFCHHLSIYRLTLPNNISMSPALLILDGHSSRLNKSALLYLIQHNVQILILPSHTTHLLQPFDVIVAHSLKSKYRKIFNSYLIRIINEMPTLSRTGQLRRAMCQAFIDAWNSLPGETFRNAFKVSCLVPFDLQRLSNSTFLSDVEYAPPHNTILNQISGSHLTHPVTFAAVLGESPLMFPTLPNGVSPLIPNSYFVGDSLIIATLKSLDLSTSRLLSEPPKEHYLASFNGVLIWARQF